MTRQYEERDEGELLAWLQSVTNLSYRYVGQCRTGAAFCYLLHGYHPWVINVTKVITNPCGETDCFHNFCLLQTALARLQVSIPQMSFDDIIKGNRSACLDALWKLQQCIRDSLDAANAQPGAAHRSSSASLRVQPDPNVHVVTRRHSLSVVSRSPYEPCAQQPILQPCDSRPSIRPLYISRQPSPVRTAFQAAPEMGCGRSVYNSQQSSPTWGVCQTGLDAGFERSVYNSQQTSPSWGICQPGVDAAFERVTYSPPEPRKVLQCTEDPGRSSPLLRQARDAIVVALDKGYLQYDPRESFQWSRGPSRSNSPYRSTHPQPPILPPNLEGHAMAEEERLSEEQPTEEEGHSTDHSYGMTDTSSSSSGPHPLASNGSAQHLLPPWAPLTSNVLIVCVRVRPPLTFAEIGYFVEPKGHANEKGMRWRIEGNRLRPYSLGVPSEPSFTFHPIFGPRTKSEEVYHGCCRDIVRLCWDGANGCIMAYGDTNSGKTYTLSGPKGVVECTAVDLFDKIADYKKVGGTCTIRASFYEVYNDEVIDLLQSTGQPRPDAKCKTTWGGFLVQKEVTSVEGMLRLHHKGAQRRHVGRNNEHQHASRSHAILQLNLLKSDLMTPGGPLLTCSQLEIVDLAGSETSYQPFQATHLRPAGEYDPHDKTINGFGPPSPRLARSRKEFAIRCKEGASIRKSLLALTKCMRALGDRGATQDPAIHIPFRESMLTRVLSSSLVGPCNMVIICTVNLEEFKGTLATLNFGQVAKLLPHQPLKQDAPAPSTTSIPTDSSDAQPQVSEVSPQVSETSAVAPAPKKDPKVDTIKKEIQRLKAELARLRRLNEDFANKNKALEVERDGQLKTLAAMQTESKRREQLHRREKAEAEALLKAKEEAHSQEKHQMEAKLKVSEDANRIHLKKEEEWRASEEANRERLQSIPHLELQIDMLKKELKEKDSAVKWARRTTEENAKQMKELQRQLEHQEQIIKQHQSTEANPRMMEELQAVNNKLLAVAEALALEKQARDAMQRYIDEQLRLRQQLQAQQKPNFWKKMSGKKPEPEPEARWEEFSRPLARFRRDVAETYHIGQLIPDTNDDLLDGPQSTPSRPTRPPIVPPLNLPIQPDQRRPNRRNQASLGPLLEL